MKISGVFLCAFSQISIEEAAFSARCCYENRSRGAFLKRWYIVVQSLEENRKDGPIDTFLDRMEAQCERIRRYRAEVISREGRKLSYDEAALEWIERYAEVFARDNDAR